MATHYGVTQPPGPDAHDQELRITRLESYLSALVDAQKNTIEAVLELAKMTGGLSPAAQSILKGHLEAVEYMARKK